MRNEFKSIASVARDLRRTPANRLIAALHTLAHGHSVLLRHEERAWASITFAGSRHALTLRFAGHMAIIAGEAFIAALPEHEFAIPGSLVAEATVTGARHALLPTPSLEVECEILLLDDD